MNTLTQLFEDNTINMEKLDSESIGKLAASLSMAARVPEGTELVSVIGFGNENDNHEAVHSWISKQTNIEYASNPREIVEQLLHRFEYEINELMNS